VGVQGAQGEPWPVSAPPPTQLFMEGRACSRGRWHWTQPSGTTRHPPTHHTRSAACCLCCPTSTMDARVFATCNFKRPCCYIQMLLLTLLLPGCVQATCGVCQKLANSINEETGLQVGHQSTQPHTSTQSAGP
jgi:hypothetical protein